MPVRIEYEGFVLTVDNSREAVEIIRDLRQTSAPEAGTAVVNVAPVAPTVQPVLPTVVEQPVRTSAGMVRNLSGEEARLWGRALKLLTYLKSHGPSPVHSNDLQQHLGITDGKILGGARGSAYRILSDLGMRGEEVFTTELTRTGRYWKVEEKIDEAIEAISRHHPQAALDTTD
ncbi:MAG: hypothetical protein ACO1SV_03225 [Fimbriimonas sp.]